MYDEYMYNTAAEPTLSVTKTIPARKWGQEVHCLVAASGGEQVAANLQPVAQDES